MALNVHQPQLITEITVFSADGRVKEVRRISPLPSSKDELEFIIRNQRGQIVQRKCFPMRSFVKNWPVALLAMMGNANESIVETDGNPRAQEPTYTDVNAPANNDTYGIWPGTDDGTILPLAPANYNLGGKIAHGTGAGQLSYSLVQHTPTAASNSDWLYQTFRTFTNSSGGTITVQEVGLVGQYVAQWMMCRDLQDENGDPINAAVLDTQTLEIRYKWKITQAAGWVKNFLLATESCHQDKSVTVKDTGGDDYGLDWGAYSNCWNTMASLGADTYGIVVGGDNAALNSADYALTSKIAHGTGAGQISYGAAEKESPVTVDGNDVTFAVKRTFSNNSGGSITVKEAGIHVEGRLEHFIMIARTLTGSVSVADTESVQIRYIFKYTV